MKSDPHDHQSEDDNMWLKMIEDGDVNGDGEISLDEFELLMTTLLYNHN